MAPVIATGGGGGGSEFVADDNFDVGPRGGGGGGNNTVDELIIDGFESSGTEINTQLRIIYGSEGGTFF